MQGCIRAHSARRLAIKWFAAPRGEPRKKTWKKIGPFDAGGVPFLPPKNPRPMPPASAGCTWPVAYAWNCMRCMGFMGFMGCMVRWGIYRFPPSVPTKNYPCQGRHRHIRQSAKFNLGALPPTPPALMDFQQIAANSDGHGVLVSETPETTKTPRSWKFPIRNQNELIDIH